MSKQVTAYNAVNNSTVSRTSASKYGKIPSAIKGGSHGYHEQVLSTDFIALGKRSRSVDHWGGEPGRDRGNWFQSLALGHKHVLHLQAKRNLGPGTG